MGFRDNEFSKSGMDDRDPPALFVLSGVKLSQE